MRPAAIDRAVEQLFLEAIVPDELDLGLAVEREVGAQAQSLERQWKLRIERAEHAATRAERRYKAVDPDNRVVARTLENDRERCLRELDQVRAEYDKARHDRHVELTDKLAQLPQFEVPAARRGESSTSGARQQGGRSSWFGRGSCELIAMRAGRRRLYGLEVRV